MNDAGKIYPGGTIWRVRFGAGHRSVDGRKDRPSSKATVVTLYLLPRLNRQLRPRLWRQLEVGSRVVSHGFDMGDEWPPERTETLNGTPIHYWTITEAHKTPA
jgi:hypothetical protein